MFTSPVPVGLFPNCSKLDNGSSKVIKLISDLNRTLQFFTMGAVTITSQPADDGNGIAWVIRGPKNTPVVRLQYDDESRTERDRNGTSSFPANVPVPSVGTGEIDPVNKNISL